MIYHYSQDTAGRAGRVSREQKEFLLVYMQSRNKFAAHAFMGCSGKEQRSKQLGDFAKSLNNIGPAIKSPDSWWQVLIFFYWYLIFIILSIVLNFKF